MIHLGERVIYSKSFWDYLHDTGSRRWSLHVPRIAHVGRVVSVGGEHDTITVVWPHEEHPLTHFSDHLEVLR